MAENIQNTVPQRQPQGSYPGKLDDKGRLKLPVKVESYLRSLPDKEFFVTSVDKCTARIYPISMWMATVEKLDQLDGSPEDVAAYVRTAQRFGAEVEMDSSGRLQFNPELRRGLGLEGEGLHLIPVNGWYEVITDAKMHLSEAESSEARKYRVEGMLRKKS